ncbi:hypothetical protein SAMN05216339_101213 [Nitrosomonas eutropha]|uniref:Uncharacterized protein n=1 Tax=Nitrosomonas eutropha TaxID=916 RepID=A0A1I7F0I6_9PROT|nr:hypothetical protein SAMN05216339_101213 [Nitrosomonas eutropha]
MRERSAGSDGVLVEAVGGVALGAVGITRPLVQIIGPALACDFLRLVTGVAVGLILRGPCQVVSEAGKCTLGAVGIAGGSTVTQRYCGTTAEVIPGVGGQVDRAGFLDRGRTVERVIGAGDVERSLRPGEPGAVACRIILVGERLAAGSGAGQPSSIVIDIADGIAGFVGSRRAAEQVVGVGDIVRSGRIMLDHYTASIPIFSELAPPCLNIPS